MFCPECGAEYREGVSKCADCGCELVAELPEAEEAEEAEYVEFVTVYKVGNPAILALAKSILQSAGIEYCVIGEGVQDLFGLGRIGAGFNVIVGQVEIRVDSERADEAIRLLADIEENPEEVAPDVDAE
jgi:hypothetical protein